MLTNLQSILKQYWGYDAFRPMQEEIIQSLLADNDTLAILPTGGGKSICYQLPAMARPGVCLVVSPLIALMKDQVEGLRRKNITALSLQSGMSRRDVENTLKVAANSNCRFLYVSPERLESALFLEYLPALSINFIAVDEAHCISQWGYDFRPPYLRVAAIREVLAGIPLIALTASATEMVQHDICQKLQPAGSETTWNTFRQSFSRPNLSYSVFKEETKIVKIVSILNNVPGSGIVYCKSRKKTKTICEKLQLHNISAAFYHAGLGSEQRTRIQEQWLKNEIRVMVSTNAFGMGIDKPDVRTVIHADVPECLENYYQEAGRAGRDGKKSYAVLLYSKVEIDELNKLPEIKFPALEVLKETYKAVMNFLQIPEGETSGNYYDFEYKDFVEKFNLPAFDTLYALKALEQSGWLALNEQVYLPSTIQFITNRNDLLFMEQHHPRLDQVAKTLLRAYDGIFDAAVFISEKFLADKAGVEKPELVNILNELHQKGYIIYKPQKDTPQLYLQRSRIKSDDLFVDAKNYQERKTVLKNRIAAMVGYVTGASTCRSKLIGNYFGDKDIADCGVCDICLNKKRNPLTSAEFEKIEASLKALGKDFVNPSLIIGQNKPMGKEKIWQVLNYLLSENKLQANAAGEIKWNG